MHMHICVVFHISLVFFNLYAMSLKTEIASCLNDKHEPVVAAIQSQSRLRRGSPAIVYATVDARADSARGIDVKSKREAYDHKARSVQTKPCNHTLVVLLQLILVMQTWIYIYIYMPA